jgi:hypothetical protein
MSESAEDGTGHGRIVMHDDLSAAVAERERAGDVRWVWTACGDVYPALLRAGVRVERCHDVALTEALLLAREGRQAEPATLAAAWARLGGVAGSGLALGGAAGSRQAEGERQARGSNGPGTDRARAPASRANAPGPAGRGAPTLVP